ncbi:HD domain-containing phosphohydrolase [Clostridium sp. JS66]|uniref:HD domain-containing phosphohydrolase n=1 Tax=Clostridium sp. JS66 TaxID=3064705 RepID=UPI00298EAB8C|nr:HD domain-containing phosphohydrolase [Clostridium sp. JS66]WPC42222.1 CHASE4 domain-containing protein [Clostridium sp. JS66]
MSVKGKALLIYFISFLFIIIFTFTAFRFIIFKYIDRVETQNLNNNFKAVTAILDREEIDMQRTCADWASWNDTYNFLLGQNKELYIKNNIQNYTLRQLNLNFMFFVDKKGSLVFSETGSLEDRTKRILMDELFNKKSKFSQEIVFKNNSDKHSGVLMVNGKLFIISYAPVTTSDGKTLSDGGLIIGRYVDDSLLNYINSIVECKVRFIENTYTDKESSVIRKSDSIMAYRQIDDINEKASITISISMLRNEYNLGKFYFKIFIGIFLAVLILVILVFINVFNKVILKRLKVVNEFIDSVSKTKDTKARLSISGNDEITNIANSTNKMLSKLYYANDEILSLSYSDKLTGLKNRVYMEKKFSKLDNEDGANYSIIMGDLNGLKLTNDTFGHKIGDRLICKIGYILKNVCSQDDIIARWGGDEFIILVIDKEEVYVSNLIENIKKECERITEFGFKISIALGSAKKDEAESTEAVMSLAEERMYRSKLTESKSSRNATIMSLERTLYEKNSETEEHTQRVKKLSMILGRKVNLSKDELEELELLSLLHDIGKMGIPDNILMKPGKLTNEEWEIMKRHTEIGYRIAKATPGLAHVANEILCHHEKFDGTGYPQGLKAEAIPILSRIINIVDSFDVMTHKRVYKDASNIGHAVEELKRCSGTQFDPVIVNEFLKLLEEGSI